MTEKVSTVFVGIGGYGDLYPSLAEKYQEVGGLCRPSGVVDPFARTAPHYEWFRRQGVPVFNTLEEFYQTHTADLAVISTPIPLHKPQSLTALAHGSHVLCEKPLVPTMAEAGELERAARTANRTLGVGFQWSFSCTMNRLKGDILEGKYGRPLMLKSLICWKRDFHYYQSSAWKGRIADAQGNLIRDSVVTNATAHYLHNIFFILGKSMAEAAMPDRVEAQVYRAKDIESFDTCVLKGELAGGTFWYGASHSCDLGEQTRFRYTFEKGTVYFNDRPGDPGNHVIGVLSDGREVDYGNPQSEQESVRKFLAMLTRCRDENSPVACTVSTIKPHLAVCSGLFEQGTICSFPKDHIFEGSEPDGTRRGTYVRGLSQLLLQAYEREQLPCQMQDAAPLMTHSFIFQPGKEAGACASV